MNKLFKWYSIMNNISSYLNSNKYEYNEISIDINFVVESISKINVNKVGNYLVKELKAIYDEQSTLLVQLVKKDKVYFESKNIYYFVSDELDKLLEESNQFNNTYVGDVGITCFSGHQYTKDTVSTYSTPCISFLFESENRNFLENQGVDSEKQFIFNIVILVQEQDAYNNYMEYNQTDIISNYISNLIYDYLENTLSYSTYNYINQITDINTELQIISEEFRPIILSSIKFTINYR